jgi:putative PIN family toxin of toxin-antitoxin system
MAIGSSVQLFISGSVYAEYEEVIRRPRLRRDEDIIAGMLRFVLEKRLWVRPTEAVRACTDPDDDVLLECAQAARADYLVTGNSKHFPASWTNTQIVTPRRFLEVMSGRVEDPKR